MEYVRQGVLQGRCVTDESEVFARLDSGDSVLSETAKGICEVCPLHQECQAEIGRLALYFKHRGIDSTIVGGVETAPQPAYVFRPLYKQSHRAFSQLRQAFRAGSIHIGSMQVNEEQTVLHCLDRNKMHLDSIQDTELASRLGRVLCAYKRRLESLDLPTIRWDDAERIGGITIYYYQKVKALVALGILPDSAPLVALRYTPTEIGKLVNEYSSESFPPNAVVRFISTHGNPYESLKSLSVRVGYFKEHIAPKFSHEFSESSIRTICMREPVDPIVGAYQEAAEWKIMRSDLLRIV